MLSFGSSFQHAGSGGLDAFGMCPLLRDCARALNLRRETSAAATSPVTAASPAAVAATPATAAVAAPTPTTAAVAVGTARVISGVRTPAVAVPAART